MDLSRLVEHRTAFAVAPFLLVDRHGRDVVTVVAKLSFDVSAHGIVRFARRPSSVRIEPDRTEAAPAIGAPDAPAGRRREASERLPSDRLDEKPGTDVLFVGSAWPPAGRRVGAVEVAVRLATRSGILHKSVVVHGPRVWQAALGGAVPGPAAALAPTPIVYELAWGGRDESDPEHPIVDPRNPVGMGVARDARALIGRPAPRIDDPRAPVGSAAPVPAGFGPIAADWEPRASLAGTHDHAWARSRAPLAPLDRDPRHACSAAPELWSSTPLVGDEAFEVLGASEEGAWRFRLPRYAPRFSTVVRGVVADAPTHLDTVLLDGDAKRVELVWRTSVVVPRRARALERIVVWAEGDGDAARLAAESLLELASGG